MSNAYLIIGATGGIGQAVCRALAESGARLVLCGRNEARMMPLQVQLGDDNQLLVADINSAEGRSRILDTLR
jgi:short-subunit dehydrogenase